MRHKKHYVGLCISDVNVRDGEHGHGAALEAHAQIERAEGPVMWIAISTVRLGGSGQHVCDTWQEGDVVGGQ